MSKASKHRPCPAVGREITSAECGEQRQSRLACPESCPFNLFAPVHYEDLLEVEGKLDEKTVAYLKTTTPDPLALGRSVAEMMERGPAAADAYYIWRMFFARDADHTTLAQRWETAGWSGLRNDERVLFRGKMQMRVALVEVHRVFTGGRVEVVDLLASAPVPFMLQDFTLAGIASRFSVYLAWVYSLPHYWRLSGSVITIPDMAQITAAEIVREITAHLGGPTTEHQMRHWLAEHWLQFADALTATSHWRHQQMYAQLDAKWGKAVYELRAPYAQCREHLDTLPEIAPDEMMVEEQHEGFAETRVWFDAPSDFKLRAPGGQVVLGRVLLGQSVWRLEAMGGEKFSRLRQRFEEHFGDRVRFQSERVDDLAAKLNANTASADESLVPPRLRENPVQLAMESSRRPAPAEGKPLAQTESELFRAMDEAFLDDPIPVLDNRTPREAARDPKLRPKLVQLMKQRVCGFDERNLRNGFAPMPPDDINWMLRELELNELIFDAPPWRPPPQQQELEPEPDDDFAPPAGYTPAGNTEPGGYIDLDGPEVDRPPAPLLPAEPLEMEEAAQRLEQAMANLNTALEAEDEMYNSGATILDDIDELTLDVLSEEDYSFAIPFVMQAWFALVPYGCRAPEIPFDNLKRVLHENMRQLRDCAEARTSTKVEKFFLGASQPRLMMMLLASFFDAAATVPKEIRPRQEAQPAILALLKSVVDVLDSALRPR